MPDVRLRILDTDTLSHIQRGQDPWVTRLQSLPPVQRAVAVVTMEEQLRGRLAQIARANQKPDPSALVSAYVRLEEMVSSFNAVRVLPFDEAAANLFFQLRKTHRRVGTNDLRIAAIALSANGVLVTTNVTDFRSIEGLEIEDWSEET